MSQLPAASTAVLLIDYENLVGGYRDGLNERAAPVNPAALFGQLDQGGAPKADAYAIMRVYANWSHGVLAKHGTKLDDAGFVLRHVLNGSHANAADIELIVDALTIAYERTQLRTFVIVGGDGGYAVLTAQLRALGRTVIVAARPGSTSNRLRVAADHYIELFAAPTTSDEHHAVAPPPNDAAVQQRDTDAPTRATLLKRGRKRIKKLRAEHATMLATEGIPLVLVAPVIYAKIPRADIQLHYGKDGCFSRFLTEVIEGTDLELVDATRAPAGRRIRRRDSSPAKSPKARSGKHA
ncbi:MAG: NYN domain-containing protein [Patulibacter sp.]